MTSQQRLQQALRIARETKVIELGEGILGKVPAIFNDLFPGREAVVVADCNTWRVAGEEVFSHLQAAGVPCRLSRAKLKEIVHYTQLMRYRINLLDLAKRAMIYDDLVERVFGKGGAWEI